MFLWFGSQKRFPRWYLLSPSESRAVRACAQQVRPKNYKCATNGIRTNTCENGHPACQPAAPRTRRYDLDTNYAVRIKTQ